MVTWVIDLWRRWFLLVEPVVLVLVMGAVIYWSEISGGWAFFDTYLEGTRSTLYSTLASISGSLLGFVIAAFAITVSSLGSSRLEVVQKHMGTLIATFSSATVYLGAATLMALMALLFDQDELPMRWLFYAVLLFALLSTLGVMRCVWILHNVVSIVSGPSKSRAGDH